MITVDEFAGVTVRLREAFRCRGFWRGGGPTIADFCRNYSGYDRRVVAMWLNPGLRRRPQWPSLVRLSIDLDTSATFLLLGRQVFDAPEWERLIRVKAEEHHGSNRAAGPRTAQTHPPRVVNSTVISVPKARRRVVRTAGADRAGGGHRKR